MNILNLNVDPDKVLFLTPNNANYLKGDHWQPNITPTYESMVAVLFGAVAVHFAIFPNSVMGFLSLP